MTRQSAKTAVLAPGSVIGILGGGQLGRMMASAAAELGLKVHIYAPEQNPPAAEVAAFTTTASYTDADQLAAFADSVDVVTYEFENVPSDTASILADHTHVFPGPDALRIAQNRLLEKTFLNDNGLATAPFRGVETLDDLQKAIDDIGTPCVLKTRTMGYDGKGQAKINSAEDAEAAWNAIGKKPAIVEAFISFEREISVIAARGQDRVITLYDVVDNVHKNHILHQTHVPAQIDEDLITHAHEMAHTLISALNYVGVIAVEMFACGHDAEGNPLVLVNEIAPRVHNSGHWTQDAAVTSQFEQHIRAIAGWPLGDSSRTHNAVMTNLLGDDVNGWQALAAQPDKKVHLYGKAEAREGRKMGHVTELLPKA